MIKNAYSSTDRISPLITIIIPTFNRQQYLLESIKSASNQDSRNYEVMVVDDGSTDGTESIVLSFKDERLRYLKRNHAGAVATRNYGIEQSNGEYILWLDSDDILIPNILHRYIDTISANPDADVFYGDLEVFTDDGRSQILKYADYYSEKNLLSHLILRNIFPNPGSLVRKQIYKKNGTYNPIFTRAHDYEFWCRIANVSKFKHIGHLCCRWRWHEGNMSSGSVKYDTKYEARIVKSLIDRHPLKKLFPGFDWTEPDRAESLSFHKIGEILDAYKDHDSADEFYHRGAYYFMQSSDAHQASITADCLKKQSDSCSKILEVPSNVYQLSRQDNQKTHHCPLVSVIVPTFNRPKKVIDALKSIMDQTYPRFEIILVNDAGSDVERILTQIDHSHKVTYVRHSRNRGLSFSRNTAIKLAKGKYISYLDDDDFYHQEHLETLVEFLEKSDFKVAYTDAYRVHYKKDGEEYYPSSRDIPYASDFDNEKLLVRNFIPVLCVMHEKSCLNEIGYFDEGLTRLEDWDLWIRLSQKYRFAHIRKATCSFSWCSDGSTMSSGDQDEFIKAFQYIYSKHKSLANNRPLVKAAQKHILARHRVRHIVERCQGNTNQTIVQLENILKIEPNIMEAHRILASLHEKQNNPDKARFHINKSNEIVQNIIPTEPYLSLCYSTNAPDENNQPDADAHLQIHPDDSEQKLKIGEQQGREGLLDDAERTFVEILASEPNHVEARNDLACILWNKGEKEVALQELLTAMEIDPHDRDAVWNCGQFMIEFGYSNDALDIYENYLMNHPDDDDIRRAVTVLEETDGITEKSAPIVEDPGPIISWGEDLYQDGRIDEALSAFEKALAVGGDSALVHNNLAAAYQAKGEMHKAAEHLRTALKLNPEDRDALWNCGQLFIQSGLSEDALAVYQSLLNKYPDDQEVKQIIAAL